MLDTILKFTGAAALYGCTSLFLASLILLAYLGYAWDIDKAKRVKMLSIAQGHDLTEILQAVETRIAEMSYEEVLEKRAKRLREEELRDESSEKNVTETLLADEKRIDAKLKQIKTERDALDKYVKDQMDRYRTAGIAEETRLIEQAEPEFAKSIILRLVKDHGATERVLTMLMAMDERNRARILYAMQAEDELKDLCVLLQKIGDGEPLSKVLQEAKQNSQQAKPAP